MVVVVILFVRMWVEMLCSQQENLETQSSSSWGCELKCEGWYGIGSSTCHPLREDVSWNLKYCGFKDSDIRHPLREDVSWNGKEDYFLTLTYSHPLREDVSWNVCQTSQQQTRYMSSSSWGCELKCVWLHEEQSRSCHPLREDVSWNVVVDSFRSFLVVILFVRMWVEM